MTEANKTNPATVSSLVAAAAPAAEAPVRVPATPLKPTSAVDPPAQATQKITVALDEFGRNPSHIKAAALAGEITAAIAALIAAQKSAAD